MKSFIIEFLIITPDPITQFLPIETFCSIIVLDPIIEFLPILTPFPIKTLLPNFTLGKSFFLVVYSLNLDNQHLQLDKSFLK